MMKRIVLPALAVAALAGSAKAEDASTAIAWKCTSQTSGPATYVINGNELKKRDDDLERYEACRRKNPVPTPELDGKISAAAVPTDPCEPLDLESYTFQIELNNPNILIAVSPAAGSDNPSTWVAKRMIMLDKHTGKYDETLLSTPTPKKQSDAGIAGDEYEGTCDAISPGNPNSVSGVPYGSHNPEPVVEEEQKPKQAVEQEKNPEPMVEEEKKPVVEEQKKPQKKSDTRKAHAHHRHHRHGHRRAG